ncbi:hypothetical protein CQW23_32750 [Capsicum baccatum]|uniref:ABC transmembrane type-1 domain-containing protein n=1 Tax=Capsicum baccatum TaxID=33114 RepID=A0A2G2V3U4_CAPBA|nr:hypothetical protein CQW23_32750 [Capsicum baccatum]
MSGDTVLIQDIMGETVWKFVQLIPTFIGGFIVSFTKGWILTLVMLSIIPLLVISDRAMSLLLARMESRGQDAYAKAETVTIPIPVHFNSSYDEFVARVMQSGDLDCMPSDMMISYLMYLRKKMNPTIINNDVRMLTYIINADVDGFRPILRIYVVERFFEGPLNSPSPPPRHLTVDDDLIDNDLNDYENDDDHPINMKDDSMHMEDFLSNSQDDKEDRGMGSQP